MKMPKLSKNSVTLEELGAIVRWRLETNDFQGLNPKPEFTGDLDEDMKSLYVKKEDLKELEDSDKNLPYLVEYRKNLCRPIIHAAFLFKGRNFRHGVSFVKKYLKDMGLMDVCFAVYAIPGKMDGRKVLETYVNAMFSTDGKKKLELEDEEKQYGYWGV